MRYSIAVIVAVMVGCMVVPASARDGKVKHPDDLRFPDLVYSPPDAGDFKIMLACGAPAFIVEDRELPTFDLQVLARTGVIYESSEKTGLADMVGYLMRNGGTRSFTARELDDRLEYLAGTVSCQMGMTSAVIGVSTLSKDIDEALEILVEVLRYPAFDPEEVERYRADRIEELKLRNNDTRKIESREWAFLIYGDHPYTKQYRETQRSLESITVDDIKTFHEEYFFPGNFIVAAAGDFEEAELVAKLNRAFADWPNRNLQLPDVPEVTWAPAPGVYMVDKKDVNQARVRIGHLGIRRDNPDFYAVSLMNYVLGGGGFSSRITQRVRSDEGLSYNQGSSFATPVLYDGDFRAYFQTKPATVAFGSTIILEEIERIREELVEEETLEDAKQNIKSMLVNSFVDKWTAMRTFAGDLLTERPKDYWKEYDANYQAVSAEQVKEAARMYLRPDRLVYLVVGDSKQVRESTEGSTTLSDFGPVVDLALPDPLTLER